MSEAETCPIPLEQLPEPVARAAQGPKGMRMAGARGANPLVSAFSDQLLLQFVLRWDADPAIQNAAQQSLQNPAPQVAQTALGDPKLHPAVLAHLAELHADQEAYIEKILLNPGLPPEAVVEVAKRCSVRVISDLVVTNQDRLLKCPEIARSVLHNPFALQSDKDRAVDFLVRNGVILEGEQAFDAAYLRLTGEERQKAAEHVVLAEDLLDDRFKTAASDSDPSDRDINRDDEEEEHGASDEEILSLEQRLSRMTVAEKVAAATKGNKTVRTTLLRDTNRLVAVAAISSPAITEPEVEAAARAKNVNADVIGHIIRDKKNNWVKKYSIKKALVNNPKTPPPDASKLLPTLQLRDMKEVSKSRNVPAALRAQAGKLLKAKGKL